MTGRDGKPDLMISELVRGLRPVRAPGSAWLSAGAMSLAAGILIALVFGSWLGLQPRLAEKMSQVAFWFRSLAWVIAGVVSVLAVQRLSIPGRSSLHVQRASALLLPLLMAAVFGVLLLASAFQDTSSLHLSLSESACTFAILILSALPSAMLMLQSRRNASTTPGWSGALIGLAASLLASAALGLHCPDDSPLHLLLWHLLLPAWITATICAGIGTKLLRW